MRDELSVSLVARGHSLRISGRAPAVSRAAAVVEALRKIARSGTYVDQEAVFSSVRDVGTLTADQPSGDDGSDAEGAIEVYPRGRYIRPRTPGQKDYVKGIAANDLVFCIGPAGTGKTYLAVAMAVAALKQGRIKRIILVRPAVEAGERLGFLPGDMQAKVNPYLRPLFDALHDMMEFDQIKRLMVNDVIEVIPLAFMRGRTLNDSVVILDESQNTTAAQMLMFLTRLGHNSKMIVTGDISQIDLPPNQPSGMIDAWRKLRPIKGVAFVELTAQDIVRHRLVNAVVKAYGSNGSGRSASGRKPDTAHEG
ncbi:MAG: AAA family ATPase [Actinobacteria bacterium]|nr:AAA family ATPase [Actinomycetota bacterium]